MGIKQLYQILKDHAPDAIKERHMANYMGRALAIDASMCIYQVHAACYAVNI
jgi:flap endonuclease-1